MDLFFSSAKEIAEQWSPDAQIVLYRGDVQDLIAGLPDNSISLIVTSPPYNLGKDYEDRVSIGKYLDSQSEVITESTGDGLRKGSTVC